MLVNRLLAVHSTFSCVRYWSTTMLSIESEHLDAGFCAQLRIDPQQPAETRHLRNGMPVDDRGTASATAGIDDWHRRALGWWDENSADYLFC